MTTLPDDARLHETAVQAVARDEVHPPRRRRTPARRPKAVAQEWTRPTVDAHPALQQLVLKLGVDPKRVEVRSNGEIVIHNQPGPWR